MLALLCGYRCQVNAVSKVRPQQVETGFEVHDPVGAAVAIEDVVPALAEERRHVPIAKRSDEKVVTIASGQDIVSTPIEEMIVSGTAVEVVVAGVALQPVATIAAGQEIVTGAAFERVVACFAPEEVSGVR